MSGMFWIALELSIRTIGFNIMLSLTVKNLDAFKFDGVAVSDNTEINTKQDAKKQGPRSRKKYSFFTKVTECFSGCFDLISTLLPLNVPISHGSQVVGSEKSLPR